MKKITAIVRLGLVGEIISSIMKTGCRCISVVDTCALGDMIDPENEHLSFRYEGGYTRMSRIEVLCREEDVDGLVAIVKAHGQTDHRGDGIVYVSSVERAVWIQEGQEGEHTVEAHG